MKRIHESVDYVKHRDRKQVHSVTEQLERVGLGPEFEGVVDVSIPEYKIVRDQKKAKFTVYIIRVVSDVSQWEVSRRYNDFWKLHDAFTSSGLGSLPQLPPKRVFGGFGAEFLEGRRSDLEAYLTQLVAHDQALSNPCLRNFLWKSHRIIPETCTATTTCTNPMVGLAIPTQNRAPLGADDSLDEGHDDDFYSPFATPEEDQDQDQDDSEVSSSEDVDSSSDVAIQNENASDASNASRARSVYKPKTSDFHMVRVLGKGSFGKVMLCKKKDTGKLYAIKVLKKQHVVARKQIAHTKTERSVLGIVDHPFVVKLHYAFQTGDKLHFVLDFCSGGELFFHLGRAGRFNETLGMFYSAEIALALGHLHTKGIVYRDLKPENILLDAEGHIKLADFGLSKEGIQSGIKGTHSFCGTPEYLAPEVLNRTGHGTSVDWWSLGALLYEMLTGLPPWYSQDRKKMFACIRGSVLRFPEHVSVLAQQILSRFLERDVTKRLGSMHDVEEVKEHPFFARIDWDLLYQRKIRPPFVPHLSHQTDTANFDSQFTRMSINSFDTASRSPSHGAMSEGPVFDGFTYINQSTVTSNVLQNRMHPVESPRDHSPTPSISPRDLQFHHNCERPQPSSPMGLTNGLLFE